MEYKVKYIIDNMKEKIVKNIGCLQKIFLVFFRGLVREVFGKE